jgi:uncharacterized membrane protein (UPF0136 family)
MPSLINFITITYAIMLFIGGLIGFFKAHSTASLLTGTISSVIVISAWQLCSKKPRAGYLFISAISLILFMFFLIRFTKSYAFMPGGLMLILSTITLLASTMGYFEVNKGPQTNEEDEEIKQVEEKSKA